MMTRPSRICNSPENYTPSPKELENVSAQAIENVLVWQNCYGIKNFMGEKIWVKISRFYYAKVQDLKSKRTKGLMESNLTLQRNITYNFTRLEKIKKNNNTLC